MTSLGIENHDMRSGADRRADAGRVSIPWQTIIQALLAGFIVLGGYVWNQTVQRVQTLETTVASRGERIAVLEVRSEQQNESIRLLRNELLRMNDKLDALLRRP